MTSLHEQLMRGFWRDINPHLQRNAILVVSPELDLVDVATKVTQDDIKSVELWLQARKITRPTPLQINSWDHETEKEFNFIIVAPYVLIQELAQ